MIKMSSLASEMSHNVQIFGESGFGGSVAANATNDGVVVAMNGGVTRLHCHCTSFPAPRLSWTLDGELLVLPNNRLVYDYLADIYIKILIS